MPLNTSKFFDGTNIPLNDKKVIRFTNASINASDIDNPAMGRNTTEYEVIIPTPPVITNSLTWTQSTGVLSSNVSGVISNATIDDASAILRGLVNTSGQTFAGNKTFTGNVSVEGNTTLGNATTDRVTITSQVLGATPLVFQGATDNAFTQSFSFIEPTANRTSTFRNVDGEVAHVFHDGAKAVVVGTNTVTHNLNLTNPNAVIIQAFDTTTNQQVVLNMSSATANSFQFTSTVPGIIRVTCIG